MRYTKLNMLCGTAQSLDACRTASVSEKDHKQAAAVSSTVTDWRQKSFFVRICDVRMRLSSQYHCLESLWAYTQHYWQ